MRLLSLDGQQVGHWDAPLRLTLSRRLTVVLGDNEAGKSTLRRAIRALLFGPDKTLAAPLTVAAFDLSSEIEWGGATQVLRRKGRSLQSQPPPDLASLLDASNAGRFADLFDLAHDNLLPHASVGFLKADGVLGSLMFGARTGVSPTQLQQAREQVDKALAEIDSRKQGNKGIPHFQQRYRLAADHHRALARFADSDDSHRRFDECEVDVRRLDAELKRLDAETRRLGWLVESVETVECLAASRQELKALTADGSPPSLVRVAELTQRLSRVEELAGKCIEAEEALAEASDALEAAEAPGELHTLAAECDGLRDVVAGYNADQTTLRELRQKQAEKRNALVQILERLGDTASDSPEVTAHRLLRPEPMAAQLRALIKEQGSLRNDLQQKQALLAAAKRTLEGLAADAGDEASFRAIPLDDALVHLETACDAESELEQLRKECDGATVLLQRQRSGQGLSSDVEDPYALDIPGAEVAMEAEGTLNLARTSLDRLKETLAQQQDELDGLQQRLVARREDIGSVASADDLANARGLRDARLELLCAALESDATELSSLPSLASQARELRQLVRQSDLLVDRRVEAGEAIGLIRAEEGRVDELLRQLSVTSEALEACSGQVASEQQSVAALWAFLREPPTSAKAWFEQFKTWRETWDAQRQREAAMERLAQRFSAVRQDVLVLVGETLPQLAGLATAQAMRSAVNREREARNLRATQIETLRRQRKDAEAAVRTATDECNAVDSSLADWGDRWAASTSDLPAGLGRQPAAVESWLGLQDDLRRVLAEAEELNTRLASCDEVSAEKRRSIEAVLDSARALVPGLPLPAGLDPSAAFALVDRDCRASASRLATRNALLGKREQAERVHTNAIKEHDAARSALLKEWAEAGLDEGCTRESLHGLEQRAKQVEALQRQIAQMEAALRGRWGDDLPSVISEIEAEGKSALAARAEDLATELETTRSAREEAGNRRQDAKRALEAMQEGRDATAVVQEVADAREALFDRLQDRYRLSVAKLVLDQAHREASDGGQAIEAVASDYFRTLTDGAYRGLRIDHDVPGEPQLVAVESTRSEKSLDQLSAGTRDQVWLSLRLASILAAARETPFPLLLDDSLVQFDDTRAKATLNLLHAISEQVQVILFTHHDHLADLAEAVVPTQDLALVVLPTVSGEMRMRSAGRPGRQRRARPASPMEASWLDTKSEDHAGEAPVRRRGGSRESGLAEAKALILDLLSMAGVPLGKAEILQRAEEQGADLERLWNQAKQELLTESRINQAGDRRGARYSVSE